MVAEMALSKVDNKAKLESTLKEEAAIRQDNKDREMERLADAAEKAAREGELELEAESVKADMAAHSETLRDTAPVIEGLKVRASHRINGLHAANLHAVHLCRHPKVKSIVSLVNICFYTSRVSRPQGRYSLLIG
ncbi:mitochondrial proton/calcium exchanger protein-like isoform X1 [Pseudoliparis swirei]|uniref:mitochondrial proton/calcium exchanger protein-like isoform X1 n=1 Tax=Pseudoliparis swirei TaxID=2059687 RepID=UPI0024BE30F5|nr:mitochondrial proton/calcium exchanger protein-like isoform X1 [Pseudoliparis swirei]